jgi:hypothetical protein
MARQNLQRPSLDVIGGPGRNIYRRRALWRPAACLICKDRSHAAWQAAAGDLRVHLSLYGRQDKTGTHHVTASPGPVSTLH